MKKLQIFSATLLAALPLILIGCGGGGGDSGPSGTPTATPRATATPGAGARILVVQLRDSAGNSVDGIVTVGTSVLATSDGSATFRGVAAGNVSVSAEVDGNVTTRTANVRNDGSTIFSIIITPNVTPVATATIPPPPF